MRRFFCHCKAVIGCAVPINGARFRFIYDMGGKSADSLVLPMRSNAKKYEKTP